MSVLKPPGGAAGIWGYSGPGGAAGLTICKIIVIPNCEFFMRNNPRQVNYDKRNYFQPQIFNRAHTQQPNSRKVTKSHFLTFEALNENICRLISGLFMNQVLVDLIESDKTSLNLCRFELISWPIGPAGGGWDLQERDVEWAEVLVPMRWLGAGCLARVLWYFAILMTSRRISPMVYLGVSVSIK